MAKKIKLSAEQLKILQEEQELLLKVKQGLLILAAENKKHKKQTELWRSTAKTINKILNSK